MGVSERSDGGRFPLQYGMHVVDAHEQILGTVLLVRKDNFVIRQELVTNQLVELPWFALAGVIGGLVFLNLTPGELEIVGKVLDRRERIAPEFETKRRIAARPLLVEPAV